MKYLEYPFRISQLILKSLEGQLEEAERKELDDWLPHLLYPAILDDAVPEERQAGIGMGLTLLHRCDELWCFGPVVSSGMQAEIAEAERLRIPVHRMDMAGELIPEKTQGMAVCG